jgi:hypothetical protein
MLGNAGTHWAGLRAGLITVAKNISAAIFFYYYYYYYYYSVA